MKLLRPRNTAAVTRIESRLLVRIFVITKCHRPLRPDVQHRRGAARLPQLLQQREAIHLGEHEIGDHHGRVMRLDELECFFTRRGRLDFVPPLPNQAGQTVSLGRLVVDDEHLAALHLIASQRTHNRNRLWSLRSPLRRSLLLLDLQVVDDDLDTLRLAGQLLGARPLVVGLDGVDKGKQCRRWCQRSPG